MEILIEENGYVNYLIEFEEGDYEASVRFSVFEVSSWKGDNNEPLDSELYLKGFIKWDGCSHIWFGDENGYLHLCGKTYFEQHKRVMDAIWNVCSKKIKLWDNDMAS